MLGSLNMRRLLLGALAVIVIAAGASGCSEDSASEQPAKAADGASTQEAAPEQLTKAEYAAWMEQVNGAHETRIGALDYEGEEATREFQRSLATLAVDAAAFAPSDPQAAVHHAELIKVIQTLAAIEDVEADLQGAEYDTEVPIEALAQLGWLDAGFYVDD
jgi:hypothetical protein